MPLTSPTYVCSPAAKFAPIFNMPFLNATRLAHCLTLRTGAAMYDLVDSLRFDHQGLIPVIAQQHDSGEVLMLAWMNRQAINQTIATGQVWYWSRSRGALWRKGQTSGQTQRLVELRIDCDHDALLVKVDQTGVACHTGRRACFFSRVESGRIVAVEPVVIDPAVLHR